MNPVLVEAHRGNAVESAHRGALAVVDADGGCVLALGDIQRPIFPRSAVKVLQALPLVASGAADALQLSDEELALACASHNGEPAHVATAAGMLAKAGRGCARAGMRHALALPRGLPARDGGARRNAQRAAQQLLGQACRLRLPGLPAGGRPAACSTTPGATCRPTHPVMREVTQALQAATGCDLSTTAHGIDGCSIPTYAHPAAAPGAGLRARRHRHRPERRPCARRAAAAPGRGQGAVHGRRHRPLRHARDAAAGRARVLQGRRRRRVLRGAARARPGRGPEDRRRQQRPRGRGGDGGADRGLRRAGRWRGPADAQPQRRVPEELERHRGRRAARLGGAAQAAAPPINPEPA